MGMEIKKEVREDGGVHVIGRCTHTCVCARTRMAHGAEKK